jgi:hypothetical protein
VGAAEECTELLGIPQAAVTDIKARLTAYEAAYTACESPNTGKLDRQDRKAKRAALTDHIRRMKKAYTDGDSLGKVTPEIRMKFGLPLMDTTRTSVPVSTAEVPFTLENGAFLQITLRHPSKPERYNGAVAFYKVGGRNR